MIHSTIHQKKVRIGTKFAHVFLSKHWAAPSGATREAQLQRQENRKKLQLALNAHLLSNKKSPNTRRSILKKQNHSLSHTEKLGGFVISTYHAGLDIELSRRTVSAAVQRRLGTEAENKLFSNPIELWTAKEAAWKAFFKHPKYAQPDVISDIHVLRKITRSTFEFQIPAAKNTKFVGRIFKLNKHTIAVVLV